MMFKITSNDFLAKIYETVHMGGPKGGGGKHKVHTRFLAVKKVAHIREPLISVPTAKKSDLETRKSLSSAAL
jgi:hypothetical protein